MTDPWSEPAIKPAPSGPLAGRRVLIVRPRAQSSSLSQLLAELGATTLLVPVAEIAPPAELSRLGATIAEIGSFDLVVLTSANAVESLAAEMPRNGTIRRLAVIGSATLARFRELNLPSPTESPVLLPPKAVAESLADTLDPLLRDLIARQGSARVLLPRAEQAREVLPDRIRATGAELTVVPAYRNRVPADSRRLLQDLFADPQRWPDAIPFTSSSSVTNLLSLLEAGQSLPERTGRISIGPVTSETLRQHGLPPHAESAEPNVAALAAAVLRALTSRVSR